MPFRCVWVKAGSELFYDPDWHQYNGWEPASVEFLDPPCWGFTRKFQDMNNFIGDWYNEIVNDLTGISLRDDDGRQKLIPAETVKMIAEKLQNVNWKSYWLQRCVGFKVSHPRCQASKSCGNCYDSIEEQEFNDLVRMFVAHANENHQLLNTGEYIK